MQISQLQLQTLLQLRRSQKPLTKLQLGTTVKILKSLSTLNYIEIFHNPITAKITTNGILATNEYINNNPIVLSKKQSYLKEYELFELISLYYPNESLFCLIQELRFRNFTPVLIEGNSLYSCDKVIEMFDCLRNHLCN